MYVAYLFISAGGEQVGAGCKSWHGTSERWLLPGWAGQREMRKGTTGKARRSWEEQGIRFAWCHSAAPQLFGPLWLKSMAKRSLPRAGHTQKGTAVEGWSTRTDCSRLPIDRHTHTRPPTQGGGENRLISSWQGRIFKSDLWFAALPKLGIGKKWSNGTATYYFLNIHAVRSILVIRGTPKPIPKLSTYKHRWEKHNNTRALLFLCFMLMRWVCLLSARYGTQH